MSSEPGGVDRPVSGESVHKRDEVNGDSNDSLLDQIPDGQPACLDDAINDGSDRWFQYQGQLLFDRSKIPIIAKRLERISKTDFNRVETTETPIKWWETAEFIDEVERRWEATKSNHSFLVAVPTPNIKQVSDPRQAVVKLEYDYYPSEIRTRREWKQQLILATLREFDYWAYHNEIIKPAVDTVSL